MSKILPVKGARDFYPEEMAMRGWLYRNIRVVSESFGYQEFEGPFLERLELYAAKSGDELVKQQSFVFEDRGGEMIALRPELTPSLARMVATRSQALPRPIRWWSFGPFWRYERPQKGRSREFFQWNIDILGVDTPQADAELAAVAAVFFRNLGLPSSAVRILVNSRTLAEIQLETIGIPSDLRQQTFRAIDRLDKMDQRKWEAYASEVGLSDDQILALQDVLTDTEAWKQSKQLVSFFEAVEKLGVSDYIEYDPSIIRGLDYYTGIVFEARDADRRHRAILGGGRYDDLVSIVGGDPVPGVGFAMGDVVIGLVLEDAGVSPELRPNPAQILLVAFDEASLLQTLSISSELRASGLRAEWYPQADRIKTQLKYADRQGIPIVLILGPDELANGQVTIKDMRSGDQISLDRSDMIEHIGEIL
ncbi:MAG TPA: histidine--tRNA ligase [Anaerolineae bacterium]|nr:histidine--tRNA ligase [Anaerolineae bacterium]